jgi:hypothetical protein
VTTNRFCLLSAVAISALLGTTATAQTSRPPAAPDNDRQPAPPASQPDADTASASGGTAGSKWEIEVHGGVATISSQHSGSGGLPTTGAVVGGLIGVSSFYLGDGARLFNQNQTAAAGGQIVPLDAVLIGPAIREQGVGTFGIRVGRALNRRLTVEASGDLEVVHLSFAPATLSAIEATRASFTPALERALSSPAVTSAVTSAADIADRKLASHLYVAGALIVNLKEAGKVVPYLAVGAGALFNDGDTPSATLVGTYRLQDPPQILGSDTVTVRYAQNSPTLVWTGGGGVKYLVTPRWGIRFDARAHLYSDSTVNLLDVSPATALQSTGAPFPIIRSGALQFSATAPLTGAAVGGATTYAGSGLQAHVVLAAGFFLRF